MKSIGCASPTPEDAMLRFFLAERGAGVLYHTLGSATNERASNVPVAYYSRGEPYTTQPFSRLETSPFAFYGETSVSYMPGLYIAEQAMSPKSATRSKKPTVARTP